MSQDSLSRPLPPADHSRLMAGEILLQSRSYSLWGGSVTAQIYLPVERSELWAYLTNYSLWPELFAHITHSGVVETRTPFHKRVYQAAQKQFALITIGMDACLWVREYPPRQIRFELETENSSFREFKAELWLEAAASDSSHSSGHSLGTVLSYTVQAIATWPIPAPLLKEAIGSDLPENLRHLRSYLAQHHQAISAAQSSTEENHPGSIENQP